MEIQSKGRIIGMDIHPTVFAACIIANTNNPKNIKQIKMFSRVDMDDLEKWFKQNNEPGDIYVMESCNNSFETADRIKSLGGHAVVLESSQVGQVSKAYLKNDKIDAQKIAHLYTTNLVTEVWQPDQKTRERREVLSIYLQAVKDCTKNNNRLLAWLVEHGIARRKKFETYGDESLRWILKQKPWTDMQIAIIKTKHNDILLATENREQYKQIMANEIANNKTMLELQQLCGLRLINVFALVAIIGDISRFKYPERLVAYIGLQPTVKQSGINEYHGRTSRKGRKDLKALLVQAAQAVISKGHTDLSTWGQALSHRRGKNIAVIATARKLVNYVWYLMRGFFVPLQALSNTHLTKLRKLATVIGSEQRQKMGFKLKFQTYFWQKITLTI